MSEDDWDPLSQTSRRGFLAVGVVAALGLASIGTVPASAQSDLGDRALWQDSPEVNMMRAVETPLPVAERTAWALSMVGKAELSGRCEQFTRTAFGFVGMYTSANLAYQGSVASGGFHHGDLAAPEGVPVFWDITSGVNAPYDHVAYSIGGGECVTTSAGPGSTIARIGLSTLTTLWGMTYRGWGEFYHNARVYDPSPYPPVVTKGVDVFILANDIPGHGQRGTWWLVVPQGSGKPKGVVMGGTVQYDGVPRVTVKDETTWNRIVPTLAW